MKSTPYETRFFYQTGHEKNPLLGKDGQPAAKQPVIAAKQKIGGFQFTEGAMQLTLPAHKSQRNAKFLERTFGVKSEVIKRVDVPTRSRSYSPKSEAEGVLGLVDTNAADAAEGQSAEGAGAAGASTPNAASLEAIRRNSGSTGARKGSSVATKTTVDPAQRAALLGNGPNADKQKAGEGVDDLT